jgi:hypothetical protein
VSEMTRAHVLSSIADVVCTVRRGSWRCASDRFTEGKSVAERLLTLTSMMVMTGVMMMTTSFKKPKIHEKEVSRARALKSFCLQ